MFESDKTVRRRFSRKGAAAAEFAILLPLIALLCLIVVDYCRVFYITQTVENSAYAGALYASKAAPHPEESILPGGIQITPAGGGSDLNFGLGSGIEDLGVGVHLAQVDPVVQAVLAESASLNPSVNPTSIEVDYQTNTVRVTVAYTFRTISSYLNGGKETTFSRTVTLPYFPEPGE